MTKDELISLLKEHLSIEIKRDYGFYSYDSYEVTLKFDGEVISTSGTPIYESKS